MFLGPVLEVEVLPIMLHQDKSQITKWQSTQTVELLHRKYLEEHLSTEFKSIFLHGNITINII